MENIYLTLPSNTPDFNDNTTSEFRVKLPNPIELQGEWEMALVEMQYPHSWDNIVQNPCKFYKTMTENSFMVQLQPVYKYKEGIVLKYEIPPGSYDTVNALVEGINYSLATWNFTAADVSKYNSFSKSMLTICLK